jgi:hypothetical protein
MDVDFSLDEERGDAFAIPDLRKSSIYAQTFSVPSSLFLADFDLDGKFRETSFSMTAC